MIYIGRVLDEAKKEWDQGKEPTRDDGCYASPVAYDVIQVELLQQLDIKEAEINTFIKLE